MSEISTRWFFLAAVVAIAGTLCASGCERKPANESSASPITIGAVLPLTGDAATYGVSLKRGMDLAVDEVNQSGGFAGRQLAVIYEDDKNAPQQGVSALNKLISADRVPAVIGPMFSAVALAVAPIAERSHVVLLSPTASAIELTNAGDYVFRIYPSDAYDGSFLAAYAYNELRTRKVAIVSLQAASTASVSNLFKKIFQDKGGTIALEDSYKENTTDFRAIIDRLKNSPHDLVFLPGSMKETTTFLRQATELGLKSRFLTISTFYDPKVLELAGNAAEGVIFSSPKFDPASDSSEIKAFVDRYRTKHGTVPDILAAYGYDSINIVALAIRNATQQTPNADSLRDALYRIRDFPGVTGKMSFDSNGDVIKELQMMTVVEGSFRPLTP